MKRRHKYFLYFGFLFIMGIGFISIFNLRVSTYQGVDYKVRILKIPLYLKITDLFSRHFHYSELASRLTEECKTDGQKILTLFKWTHENIRTVPKEFPVVDDHVYNIIVRGYGTDDQSADVFTTLCVYAGIPAKWMWVSPVDSETKYALSFVYLGNRWLVFDSYTGNYFKNKNDEIASVNDIVNDNSIVEQVTYKPVIYGVEYIRYFENLALFSGQGTLRGKMQMPWPRIIFEIKRVCELIKRTKAEGEIVR